MKPQQKICVIFDLVADFHLKSLQKVTHGEKETFNYLRWESTAKREIIGNYVAKRESCRDIFSLLKSYMVKFNCRVSITNCRSKKPFLPCWTAIMLIKFLMIVKLFYSISNDAFERRENFPVFSRLRGFLIEVKCLQSLFISHDSSLTTIWT